MKKLVTLCAITLIALNASAQLSSGLVAHWTFNGHVNDVTGKGHTGTPVNISYGKGITGVSNKAAYFNGTSSIITVPYQSDLNIDSFSICAIIKPMGFYTGTCQGNYVLCRGDLSQTEGYGLAFYDNQVNGCNTLDTSKEVFTGHARDLVAMPCQQYTPNIVTNTWYCVVVTYNGQTSNTYINGSLVSTCVYPSKTAFTKSTNGLSIGAYQTYITNFPYWLNGYVDDLRLYNRILSSEEIPMYCEGFDVITDNDGPTSIGQHELNNAEDIKIYPNPASTAFTIKSNAMQNGLTTICIYNTMGQLLKMEHVNVANNQLSHTVSVSNLPSGSYSVSVRNSVSVINLPLIITQ
ncbi:MAG: T9SS type A sorting domain-containing protein [Chitinophagales bacterium]|nr:T9SS type A sorting domain-containing protein [Chitinophagales bacterium]